ncbi:conserved membrane hypothetical protein [Tenacibaculum litopenaei]
MFMNYLLSYVLGVLLCLGSVVYGFQHMGWWLPRWVAWYLNDFLIVPINLLLILIVMRYLKQQPGYLLSPLFITCICIGYAWFFEYYLPPISNRYTADIWDVCLYCVGGFVFFLLQKLSIREHYKQRHRQPNK